MPLKFEGRIKKLLSVSATSTPVTGTREEAVETTELAESARTSKDGEESKDKYPKNLTQVSYIHYPINFGKKSVSALFESGSKVNAVHPAFAKELGLPIKLTDVGVQKIDGTTLDTYKIVVAVFSMKNKAHWIKFFKEIFLVANVSLKVVLGMLFLTLNSANVDFLENKLR